MLEQFSSHVSGFFQNIVNQSWDIQTLLSSPSVYFYIGVAVFLMYWILTILWTIKDITARTNNIFGQVISILLVGIGSPLFGLPIYLFLRPTRYKWDRIAWREALSAQVATCPSCARKNPLHHDFCAYCSQQLTIQCKDCNGTYQWIYDYCPSCGAPNAE